MTLLTTQAQACGPTQWLFLFTFQLNVNKSLLPKSSAQTVCLAIVYVILNYKFISTKAL